MAELEAPSGWRVIQLRELARITAGGDYDVETASPVETDRHPFPVYANAIERKAFHSYSSTSKHPAGALTITARGTLGFSQFRSKPFTAIGRLLVVWPNAQFDGRYLAEYLNSQVEFAVESTGVPQLTGPQAGSYEILIPENVREQEAIAEALSDADALIEGLERLIAKKRLIKQGAMQDLLTAKRRLPGFSGEWVTTQLSEHTTHGAGNSSLIKGTLQASGRTGNFPAFTASGPDLMLDFYEQNGDAIIVSAVGSRCGKSFRACGRWTAIANTHVVRCKPTLDPDFAFLFLNEEDFWVKGGTGQPFVLVRRTFEHAFKLPSLDEQRAIAEVFADIDAEIEALGTRLEKARQLKEGMMQNLLTGRIRLV
ncbi:hypothetical protein GCM10011363_08040 [Marivita lacus]|uniref:Type I restriction modification DNA specificity domain-containing protein n=1 Tax=Marivita lacus TaxID=1323742 RepID=A0ABQ1KDW4_9RHOB|nr:hypothetical protein GCM10011363_08040 [Marivita lacus]